MLPATNKAGECSSTTVRHCSLYSSHFGINIVNEKADLAHSAFILRPRTSRSVAPEEIYLIDHVFPIVDGFGIGMAQSRRNTLNLSVSEAVNQPRMGQYPTVKLSDRVLNSL